MSQQTNISLGYLWNKIKWLEFWDVKEKYNFQTRLNL